MKYFFYTLVTVLALGSCTDARTKQLNEIARLDKILMDGIKKDVTKIDKETAQSLIVASEAFVTQFPQDTAAARVLFKAAEINKGIGEYGKAIKLWGDVRDKYPTFRRAGDAVFMQAFTFDEDLHDKESAVAYYKKFIDNYPDHPLKSNAGQLLTMLEGGKELNDIIKEFEKKNKSHIEGDAK
jgi:outer membrane protein assembly factor BamD (BamD/ComL family)